ncbi:hypothetical protein Fot_11163 [Forsythia ovata]|uniref:Uncharacterized protein n=1 Tax=Forsythia ovata TaxID=205694 RepID=A0ABD1WLT5_9LAMI
MSDKLEECNESSDYENINVVVLPSSNVAPLIFKPMRVIHPSSVILENDNILVVVSGEPAFKVLTIEWNGTGIARRPVAECRYEPASAEKTIGEPSKDAVGEEIEDKIGAEAKALELKWKGFHILYRV